VRGDAHRLFLCVIFGSLLPSLETQLVFRPRLRRDLTNYPPATVAIKL
jgi:hypothetical protein